MKSFLHPPPPMNTFCVSAAKSRSFISLCEPLCRDYLPRFAEMVSAALQSHLKQNQNVKSQRRNINLLSCKQVVQGRKEQGRRQMGQGKRLNTTVALAISNSPQARTLKRGIWYQKEGQILTLIFNNIDFSSLFWYMITMPIEQLYQDYHVIK